MATVMTPRPARASHAVRASTPRSRAGLILAALGVAYLVAGTLASWYFVPYYRARGGIGDLLLHWYRGEALADLALYLAWLLSGPVGAIVAVLGVALALRVPRRVLWPMLVGGIVVTAWLVGAQLLDMPLVPPLFGVFGVLIAACFLGLLWDWARSRAGRSAAEQAGSDLRMAGHVCSLIAAWLLCGLFGAPVFLLRPAIAVPLTKANTFALTVLVLLALGWALTFLGHRVARKEVVR